MTKTILITGSTDGIGLATAKTLASLGHNILLHGRSAAKLEKAKELLLNENKSQLVGTYQADLSSLRDVEKFALEITKKHQHLDVLINNAGVYSINETKSIDNLDVRFVVNTIAPYLLTKQVLPLFNNLGRVINLSSAAQAPVNADELNSVSHLADSTVYAKSKLALTMWSRELAKALKGDKPSIVAINPKSFLGSKMVKEAYGVAGGDLQQGADILVSAALSDEFSKANGLYFDNDIGQFSQPHPDALNKEKSALIVQTIEQIIEQVID